MRRVVADELLDVDAGTPAEVAASLRDLCDVNRFLGGISLTAKLVREIAVSSKLSEISVLDTGGGEGYVLERVGEQLRSRGVTLTGTVLDRALSHLPASSSAIRAVCGDALDLPFAEAAFDVVMSNLFVHHLQPREVQRYVAGAMRVARLATVINDLERTWLHWRLAQAGGMIYRSRLTRNDAPVSVCRAYTQREIEELLRPAGFRLQVRKSFFFRLGALIWKN